MAAATTWRMGLAGENGVPMPMTDSTVHFANVLGSAESGRFPVILVREPSCAPHLA
jgi:hypothetical protein